LSAIDKTALKENLDILGGCKIEIKKLRKFLAKFLKKIKNDTPLKIANQLISQIL